MMSYPDGKKILFLGSNVGVSDMVRYAQAQGVKAIVADWYPVEKSYAKQIADEAVQISTADIDAISLYVKENGIDGVFAGIDEFNLLNAMEVARRCELPFYCTNVQWELIERKDNFRKQCLVHGVPCPKTYYAGPAKDIDLSVIEYPSVIKPVDGSTSKGVHICESEQALVSWLPDAMKSSNSGDIIVEEYFVGYEFTAHYTLHNGIACLACVDNRYPVAVHDGSVTTIPVARVYPSLFTESYLDKVNDSMVRLCESLGMKEGVLFVQGIYNDKADSFVIFEAGLRSAGEAPYRFLTSVNGINYMSLFVDTALGQEPDYDQSREDPFLHGKCCGVISFVGKGGVVGKIDGLTEAVNATPSVVDYEVRYPVGSEIPDGDTLRQLQTRFVLECDNREQMARDIQYLNDNVQVTGINGKNLVIKMEPNRLYGLE